MITDFEDVTGICPIGSDQVISWVELLFASEIEKALELVIRVVDANESQELNKTFRGKDYPTNVLSFPADIQLPDGPTILGDIAICLPVVKREADEQSKRFEQHVARECADETQVSIFLTVLSSVAKGRRGLPVFVPGWVQTERLKSDLLSSRGRG